MLRAAWNISPRAANVTCGERDKQIGNKKEEQKKKFQMQNHVHTNGQMRVFSNVYTWTFNFRSIT